MKSYIGVDVRDFIWKKELEFRLKIEELALKALDDDLCKAIQEAAIDSMEIVAITHKNH